MNWQRCVEIIGAEILPREMWDEEHHEDQGGVERIKLCSRDGPGQ